MNGPAESARKHTRGRCMVVMMMMGLMAVELGTEAAIETAVESETGVVGVITVGGRWRTLLLRLLLEIELVRLLL